jgi:hypothetical protein
MTTPTADFVLLFRCTGYIMGFTDRVWHHDLRRPVKDARCKRWDTPMLCVPPVAHGQILRLLASSDQSRAWRVSPSVGARCGRGLTELKRLSSLPVPWYASREADVKEERALFFCNDSEAACQDIVEFELLLDA